MRDLLLLAADAAADGAGEGGGISSMLVLVAYVVFIGAIFYFVAIRPQKKQQKKLDALSSSLEVGDSVLTTAGFYGVVIDVMDEIVIIEFGSNKNCRIPMKRSAVVEVEKPDKQEKSDKSDKIEKKPDKLEKSDKHDKKSEK